MCVYRLNRRKTSSLYYIIYGRGHGAICPSRANEAADIWWMRYWTQYLVPARGDSIRLATKWNRNDAPGCCCIAGGHIIW